MNKASQIKEILREHQRVWQFFLERCQVDPCSGIEKAAGAYKAAGYLDICQKTLLAMTPDDTVSEAWLAELVSYKQARLGFDSPIFSQMILSAKKDVAQEILSILQRNP